MSIIYDPSPGSRIDKVVAVAIRMAEVAEDTVELNFNGTTVNVHFSYQRHLMEEWSEKHEKQTQ